MDNNLFLEDYIYNENRNIVLWSIIKASNSTEVTGVLNLLTRTEQQPKSMKYYMRHVIKVKWHTQSYAICILQCISRNRFILIVAFCS